MTTSPNDWDAAYTANTPPPWDLGRPQPAFVRLAKRGRFHGRLLDAGCGTGEHTLLAAGHGAEAVGVDISAPAIETARRKAAERGIPARFEVADALALDNLDLTFDTAIDSGLFHVFDVALRTAYVTSLRSVLRPGGYYHLMCISDRQPGDWGPRRIHQHEIIAAFRDGWTIEHITADTFELNPGLETPTALAWRATILRQ